MSAQQKNQTPPHAFKLSAPLRRALLVAAGAFALAFPPAVFFLQSGSESPATAKSAPAAPRLADFRSEQPATDVRQMANWVATSRDHKNMSFVIIDKKEAKVYVFDPAAQLVAAAPALLGSAIGDDTAPGIGDKPLAQVQPEEKTTPAGRFVAEMGDSTRGEDVVWVDYDAGVSMHRVLNVPERLKSLASPTKEDNRMSFGCINLPPKFYENVLRPAVRNGGAVIYVLPETRSLAETFAAFHDVESPVRVAQH
jgi:hypothetical protein